MPDVVQFEDPQPRRRLSVDERRAEILRAAAREFATASYEEVSAARLAAASGSSQALVFHYFGTKAGLYAAVVRDWIELLRRRQAEADAALPPGTPVRDRVRVRLEVYLDHVAGHSGSWASPLHGGAEPAEGGALRREARREEVAALGELLAVGDWPRHRYALWGYFGFLDQACLHWVESGCPAQDRPALIDAALGALEGALGDWAV